MTFTVTRVLRWVERKMDGPDDYDVIMMGNQMQVETPDDIARKTGNKF